MDRPRMARRFSARAQADTPAPAPFYTFRPAAKASEPDELFIYDEIGFSWFDEGVTAAGFAKQLAGLKSDRLVLRINSPGGDVFDGLAIGNLLREHKAAKTVKVDALAASIASVIAVMASSGDGDELIMGPYSQFMIHDASGFGYGNAGDLRELAELLDMISDNIANVYADRAGGTPADWRKVMKGEKWYSAEETVEAGLADSVVDARRRKQCSACEGEGCAECDETGYMDPEDAKRLRVAAQWCERLFPGHEQRFKNALAATPEPALPAPAAQGPGEPVPDTPSSTGSPDVPSDPATESDEPEQLPFAWDASALTGAVRAATAPPQIDLGDWRAWFSEAPAPKDVDKNAPVDLGPPPPRQPDPSPEAPRNALVELIGAAVSLAATTQPEPAPSPPAEPELPALPPVRLDLAEVRRAVREARF